MPRSLATQAYGLTSVHALLEYSASATVIKAKIPP
jgi:hypothetical protein